MLNKTLDRPYNHKTAPSSKIGNDQVETSFFALQRRNALNSNSVENHGLVTNKHQSDKWTKNSSFQVRVPVRVVDSDLDREIIRNLLGDDSDTESIEDPNDLVSSHECPLACPKLRKSCERVDTIGECICNWCCNIFCCCCLCKLYNNVFYGRISSK